MRARAAGRRTGVGGAVGRARVGVTGLWGGRGSDFAAPGGGGLLALAKETLGRCEELVRRQGERLPK